MSPPAQAPVFSLVIGGSRLGDIPRGLGCALVIPDTNLLLKRENEVLIWRLPLVLPGSAENGVVKLYRRRGRVNRLRGGILPFRVQREYGALSRLADGGVPCSQPLVWGWGFMPEHGDFEVLVTREIPGAVNLKDLLGASRGRLRTDGFLALFESVRRMHELGVYHGALWPKNVLRTATSDGVGEFHLIDLARAVLFPGTICRTATARLDLLSLVYSLGRANDAFDCEALLRHYGFTAAEARTIAAQGRHYRSSKHVRNRLALICRLRALLAWRRSKGDRIRASGLAGS